MKDRTNKIIRKSLVLALAAVFIAGAVCTVTPAYAASNLVIGEATSDERGKIRGGKAGDQSKDEVAYGTWSYSSSSGRYNNWKYCIRAKDPNVAKKLAANMKAACANDHIGYDQQSPDRYSLYDEAKKVKWNIAAIKNNCETTCASVVGVCLYASGIPTPRYYDSSVIIDDLKPTGKFYFFTDSAHLSKKDKLEPGDILVSPGTHTIMVVDSPNYPGKEAAEYKAKGNTLASSTQSYSSPFVAGKDYQLMDNMNVRGGATVYGRIVKYSELTYSARQFSLSTDNAVFAKGTVVTCIKTKGDWIKAPSGWICGRQGGAMYLVEYKGTADQVKLYNQALANAKKAQTKKTTTTTAKKTTTTKKTTTASSSQLVIKKGWNYRLATALYVRKGPGTNYGIKSRSALTNDAKRHAYSGSKALLKAGTIVTCLEVKGEWMRIPSGWICCKKGYITK